MAAGISIAIVAIIWLGMSRIFEKGKFYALYFDESVQGLNVDAPVKYRGVAIGRVDRIRVAPDSRLIEVIVKVESGLKLENDMIAQLRVVGITGSMFIELDRRKPTDQNDILKLSFPTEYPLVGSKPSEISELFSDIDEIVQKMNTLDFEGISDRMKATLDHVDQQVQNADLDGISSRTKTALENIDRAVAGINTAVADFDLAGISGGIKTALANLNETLEPERWSRVINGLEKTTASLSGVIDNTNALLASASNVVAETDAGVANLNRHLFVVGQDLESAGRNLSLLLEQLKDQPSQLLFGEPAPPRFPAGIDKNAP